MAIQTRSIGPSSLASAGAARSAAANWIPSASAYYYLGFGEDFKNIAPAILPLRDERGLELFYNFGVTPWFHLTTDMQVITPILEGADTSLVLGLRAKIDF